MYKKFRLLLIIAALPVTIMQAQSQNDVPFISINTQEMFDVLNKNVPDMAKGHPEYGVSKMMNDCTDKFPATLTGFFKKEKPNNRPLSNEEVYAKCSDAVLMFGNYYQYNKEGEMYAGVGASATALTPDGICMTNYHVMEALIKKDWHEIKEVNEDSLYYVGTRQGKVYPVIRILGYSRAGDIAFFQVDTRGDRLAYLPLGNPLKTGAEVSVISHPQQIFYMYTKGVVARNTNYRAKYPNTDRMEITADYAVGSSGAPILDKYGNIAGMVASTTGIYFDQEKKTSLQMVLKSTVPVSVIRRVLGISK